MFGESNYPSINVCSFYHSNNLVIFYHLSNLVVKLLKVQSPHSFQDSSQSVSLQTKLSRQVSYFQDCIPLNRLSGQVRLAVAG